MAGQQQRKLEQHHRRSLSLSLLRCLSVPRGYHHHNHHHFLFFCFVRSLIDKCFILAGLIIIAVHIRPAKIPVLSYCGKKNTTVCSNALRHFPGLDFPLDVARERVRLNYLSGRRIGDGAAALSLHPKEDDIHHASISLSRLRDWQPLSP